MHTSTFAPRSAATPCHYGARQSLTAPAPTRLACRAHSQQWPASIRCSAAPNVAPALHRWPVGQARHQLLGLQQRHTSAPLSDSGRVRRQAFQHGSASRPSAGFKPQRRRSPAVVAASAAAAAADGMTFTPEYDPDADAMQVCSPRTAAYAEALTCNHSAADLDTGLFRRKQPAPVSDRAVSERPALATETFWPPAYPPCGMTREVVCGVSFPAAAAAAAATEEQQPAGGGAVPDQAGPQ